MTRTVVAVFQGGPVDGEIRAVRVEDVDKPVNVYIAPGFSGGDYMHADDAQVALYEPRRTVDEDESSSSMPSHIHSIGAQTHDRSQEDSPESRHPWLDRLAPPGHR